MRYIINFDYEKKVALVPRKIKKGFGFAELGTPEGTSLLQDQKTDIYDIGCDPTFFTIKRRKDGVWIGCMEKEDHYPDEMRYVLGKSSEVDYAKLSEAWDYFIKERNKVNLVEKREIANQLIPKLNKILQKYRGKEGIIADLIFCGSGHTPVIYLSHGDISNQTKKSILSQASNIDSDVRSSGIRVSRPKEMEVLVVPTVNKNWLVFELGLTNLLMCIFAESVDFHSPPRNAISLLKEIRQLKIRSRFNPGNKRWWEIWHLPRPRAAMRG